MLTPFPEFLNKPTWKYVEDAGFEVVNYHSLLIDDPTNLVRVFPQYIFETAIQTDHLEADALYICCGALRSLKMVSELEDCLEKPVIVSNQAITWRLLRQSGIADHLNGCG